MNTQIELPEAEEYYPGLYKPVTKMPDCPNCLFDELALVSKDLAFCFNCFTNFDRKK